MLVFDWTLVGWEQLRISRNDKTLVVTHQYSFRSSVLFLGSYGIIFHAHDIGWSLSDGELTQHQGSAEPLWIGEYAMDKLSALGLATVEEMLPYGNQPYDRNQSTLPGTDTLGDKDAQILLQLSLLGCPIEPFYTQVSTGLFSSERKLAGYRVNLHNGKTFVLDAEGTLPKMTHELRVAAQDVLRG